MNRSLRWLLPALAGTLFGCDFSQSLLQCTLDGRCAAVSRACDTDGGVTFLGPLVYASRADSPFPCTGAREFFFDDFEDGTVDLPGLTANTKIRSKLGSTDSVDADDGRWDGQCKTDDGGACGSLYSADGPTGIILEFDAGSLPQFVGLVWTDGHKFVFFEAFGPDHSSVGRLGPMSDGGFPDNVQDGGTAEDRFLGVVSRAGISSVRVWGADGGIEVDHVQYGRWSTPASGQASQ